MPGYPCCCGGNNNCSACTGSTPDTMDLLINGTVSNGSCSDCGDFSDAMFELNHGRESIGGPDEYPCYWSLEDMVCGFDIQVWHADPFLFCQLTGAIDVIVFSKNVGTTFDCTAEHELLFDSGSSGLVCDFTSITSIIVNPP